MNGSGENLGTRAERLEAVTHLAQTLSRPMTPLQRLEGLRSVNARLGRRKRLRAGGIVFAILGVATAGAGSALLFRSHTVVDVDGRSLVYRIEGGEIGDGGYIRSDDPSGSLLHFDEGTELRLMAGARGRLSSVDAHGARFAIEEGEAEVKVTPRPGARWLVDAGPFLITVRGTVFTAAWDGAKERLDVHMKKGLVSVTGPLADGMMAVRAGQHLSVNVRKKEVLLQQFDQQVGQQIDQIDQTDLQTDLPNGQESDSPGTYPATSHGASGGEPAPGAHGSRVPEARPAAPPSSAARTSPGLAARSWSAALVAGDLDSILRDAERRGLRHVIADGSSEDLAALADAARYRRRNDIAERALLAERKRFPRSVRASDSAFLLGRLQETTPNGETRALQWYDLYLKEAPYGAYSSEALGRKMTATERARGVAEARQVAEEYLRRFPHGTYAGAARALRDGP